MERSVYGRMSDSGRCLKSSQFSQQVLTALKQDPLYLGCSLDVLPVIDRKCSGRSECDVRLTDPDLRKTKPCYEDLAVYMEASYKCATGKHCPVVGQSMSLY